jgi:hypothetical protein
MEPVVLITSFIIGLVSVINRPIPFTLPNDKKVEAWQSSNLTPQDLYNKINQDYCYESERNFLSCAASIDSMGYNLGILFNSELKSKADFDEVLWEKKRLKPWLSGFKNKKYNFSEIAKNNFFEKTNIKYHKFITAMGINGYLSIKFDPHTYIKPLDFEENLLDEEIEENDSIEKIINPLPELNESNPTPLIKPFKKVVNLSLSSNLEYPSMIILKEFSLDSCNQVQESLKEIIRANSQKIIIDLKNNPGGLVHEAVCIAGIFLGKKHIVTLNHFNGNKEVLNSQSNQLYFGEIQVFIDTHSASASEILAGVLQHYKRAEIIGDISYGKGTFQNPELWPKENVSFFKTNGFFHLPNGFTPQMKGLIPDKKTESSSGRREKDLFFFPLEAD